MTEGFKICTFMALCAVTFSGCSSYNYASDLDRYKPLSHRYSNNFAARERPPTRKENWKNYKVGTPYEINGITYHPKEDPHYSERGVASWYGPKFHNRLTSNGEIFDRYALTAAHRTLPMPSIVKVTNLHNGLSIKLRVNDRGPFASNRIIDLSERAADILGFKETGLAKVKVEFDKEATEKLFYNAHDDRPSEPKQRIARHLTSPKETILAARQKKFDEHFIQTGSYHSHDNAREVEKTLKSTAPTFVEEGSFRGDTVYRVKLGPFKTVEEAGGVLDKIAYLGFNDAIIVGK